MNIFKGAALVAAPALLGLSLASSACNTTPGSAATAAAGPGSSPPAATRVIDSILPIEEQLRRARVGLPEVDSLGGGFASRDSLVRTFVRATAASDTAALNRMLLSPAEYAWLYYPRHVYSRPPYELDPRTHWMLLQNGNEKGLSRLLKYRGGSTLVLRGYSCSDAATMDPPIREWGNCRLDLVIDGTRKTEVLFGSIVAIDGRYKLVTMANQF